VFFILQLCSWNIHAQTPFSGSAIIPANPSSVDSISYVRFEVNSYCGRKESFYKIAMLNNNITVTFAEWSPPGILTIPPAPSWYTRNVDLVDLGRLPPGDYTLTTVGAPCVNGLPLLNTPPDLDKFPFQVTDGREKKKFTTTLDYSGHWWDENDPGWGLFVWQDGANNTIAAWFTYTADGKPAWYVFQPVWETPIFTRPADVWQTSKPPGTFSPPPGTTKLTTVGTASLDFYFGTYNRGGALPSLEQFLIFTYKLSDGVQQKRTLMRFKAK
jgi:hypothetical protein